jgi:hypothetical protein
MYCLVPEKPLRLVYGIICGGLLSTPRAFPAGTIGGTFFERVLCFAPLFNLFTTAAL